MSTPTQWGRTTKQLVSATLLVLAGLLLYSFRGILAPLVIVFLTAYIFAPVVGWLSRSLRIHRGLAVGLLYLVGVAALATAPAIAVPVAVEQTKNLVDNLDDIINRTIDWIEQYEQVEAFGYVIPLPDIEPPTFSLNFDKLVDLVGGTISPIAGGAFSVVMVVASGLGWVVFMGVVTFYLLVDAERIGPALRGLAPPAYREEIAKLGDQINGTWNAFLRGQIVLSVIVGVITAVAMSAVGIRFGIALGIVAALLEIVPNFGPFLAAVPAVMLALFQGSAYLPFSNLGVAILVAGLYIVIQSIENNFLVPRIIGSSLNLHPLIVIIGVLGGATLGGLLGALLAAPVLATLRTVLRYIFLKLADMEPFPSPPSFASTARERGVCAVLFDLDGTLLDTDDMLVERLAHRLRPVAFLDKLYDSRRLARRLVMAIESPLNAVVTLLDIVGLDERAFALSDWLRLAYGQQTPAKYVAVDGVGTLVRELSREYKLAIVTTRNRQSTAKFVEKFGLQDCFKSIVTRQDVRRLKPHPEPIRRAAAQLGCAPEQCIVVGDTTVDVKAGKKAGSLTVGVLCGFGERPELQRLKPDLLLETTSQLTRFLNDRQEPRREEW